MSVKQEVVEGKKGEAEVGESKLERYDCMVVLLMAVKV